MQRVFIALVLTLTIASGGCGTTTVLSNDRQARIFVNGEMIGRGQGTINKRGTSGDAQVVVKTPDGRSERQQISRSFTAMTFVLGLFTYGVCFIACWEYPDTVFVSLEERPQSSWEVGGANDPWMQPPPGWTPPPASATPAQ